MTIRRRRTAEESRALILETAAERLRLYGLEGLNITGVSEQAGLSHATLIHHFGSSGGMRDALADKMTVDLLQDLIVALKDNVSPEALTANVFKTLAEGGHAKLIAWRSVEGSMEPTDPTELSASFADLLSAGAEVLNYESEGELKQLIFLVAIAAIGYGLAGEVLHQALGMSESEYADFPNWLNAHFNG